MSAFQPATYEEAKSTFKPLQRSQIRPKPPNPDAGRKMRPASRIKRKRPVKKKVKRVKTSTLKKKAWTEFSIFIRTRGAEVGGIAVCATCGARKPWREMQAGHFIAGRLNSNLFDERGCNTQCSTCNVIRAGNGPMYYKFMLATYGQEVIDDLLEQNDQTRKWQPGELQGIFEKYKALNDANPLCQE